jgi:hypothetical protein
MLACSISMHGSTTLRNCCTVAARVDEGEHEAGAVVGAGDAAGAGVEVEVEVEVMVGTVVEPVGTVGIVGWMAPADGGWGGEEML